MLPKILAGTLIIVMSTSAAVHGSERLLAQIIPNLRQSSLEWKNREKAYDKARLGKQLDRARELHQVGFLAIDTWLANNKPTWLTSEANTKLREKAISIYIAESNAEFLRAFQAIDAGDWFNIGRIAFTMKKYSTAAMMFGMASKLSGGSVESDYWRTKSLVMEFDMRKTSVNREAALAASNAFISSNPSYYPAYYDRGYLFRILDREDEAIQNFKVALNHGIYPSIINYELGLLYNSMAFRVGSNSLLKTAKAHFQKALALDPSLQSAKESLALINNAIRIGGYSQVSGEIQMPKSNLADIQRNNERSWQVYQEHRNWEKCGNRNRISC